MQTITAFADFLYFSRKRNVLRNAYNPLEHLIISAVDLGVISSLLILKPELLNLNILKAAC